MWYKIKFEVDDGATHVTDIAIVEASDVEKAKDKLYQFIGHIDSETHLKKIYSAEPFLGSLFTGRHGCN